MLRAGYDSTTRSKASPMDFEFSSTDTINPHTIFSPKPPAQKVVSPVPTKTSAASPPDITPMSTSPDSTPSQSPTKPSPLTSTQLTLPPLSRKRKKPNRDDITFHRAPAPQDIAYLVSLYSQAAVSLTLLSLLSFAIYSLVTTIHHDLDLKSTAKSNGIFMRFNSDVQRYCMRLGNVA